MQQTPLLISQMLEYGAMAFPGSQVVTWTGQEPRRTTFAELREDCHRLANALRRLGVDADQRVATFMWNNEEHLELYLAVPGTGAVLHALNIRLFPDQLVYVANHAQDHVVVVDNTLAAPFAQLLPHLRTVEHVVVNGPVDDATRAALGATGCRVHDYRALLDAEEPAFTWPELDEDTGAAMCYTSGTTGNPKGVVYSHRSNYLHSITVTTAGCLGLVEQDVLLAIVPLFHANAWGLPYAALLSGSSVVMPDRFLQPEPLAQMIPAAAVPTIWTGLLAHLDARAAAGEPVDLTTMDRSMVGGSACPPSLITAFDERYQVRIIQGWGMTEMSPVGTLSNPPAASQGEERFSYRASQGRLLPGVQGRLVGPDGSPVPWDGRSVGELEVKGPWITGSYYTAPGEEPGADALSKFSDDGWLRTGDVGSLSPDGYLRLTDRAKDVIKSGGEWISSVDLENALMGHPKVAEASVVGVPDERWGERPLATVVVASGEQVGAEELRDFLADKVARWQLPERWAFLEEVPKTSVGKFDKKVLRRRYADGELEVTTL
jgi:fatty-acyl-CoA synthase